MDVHGLRSRSLSVFGFMAVCTMGSWCAALEKVCKISGSFRGGNNFELCFEWKLLFCDPAAASVQR